MLIHPLLAFIGLVAIPDHVYAAVQSAGIPPLPPRRDHREYPLNCRGGQRLVFDTLGSPADTATALRLSLTFTASPTAARPEGQGLQPGTCAWVDRPVNHEEPRQVRVTVHTSDTTHQATVRDTGVYWSFLAHNSDSGHFTAVGYRYWHASWPPVSRASQAPAMAPSKGSWLPFNPSQLHWYALGWVMITWVPFLALLGRWSGWRRLAGLYPDRSAGRGRSFRSGSMVMGMSKYRGGARLTPDASHLHFSMGLLLRPGHPPFSVPWSDITASRDGWPWFPLKGKPVIRLTLGKHRGLRILVPVSDGERIIEASGGRLELSEPAAAGMQSREPATSSRR